jgi:hypothetical protein
MRLKKATVFLLGLLLPLCITLPSKASGSTTFYFQGFEIGKSLENISEIENITSFVHVSTLKPSRENYSEYPPSFFKQLRPNLEEWIGWFTVALCIYVGMEIFDEGLLELLGFEILIPHPLRVVEIYEYKGDQPVEIKGNVVFDLYFSSDISSKVNRDSVEVGLHYLTQEFFPNSVSKKVVEIAPPKVGKVHRQRITLENVDCTLQPGESLLFSVEIVPSNKTLSELVKRADVKKMLDSFKVFANYLNNSEIEELKDLGATLQELLSILEDSDLTGEDIAEIMKSLTCSSFVFGSVTYPSSVTLPVVIPGGYETLEYFLHENNMSIAEPKEEKALKADLSSVQVWEGPPLEDRNRIIKEASAHLYFQFFKLLPVKVEARLLDGEREIGRASEELDKSVTFNFGVLNYELFADRSLSLEVSLASEAIGKVYLLYGSSDKPSSLTVTYGETDNIQFTYEAKPQDCLIVPGDKVEYILNISSKFSDNISVEVTTIKEGDWEITIQEDMPIQIHAEENAFVHILAVSTNNTRKAYGQSIHMVFTVHGRTGLARKSASAEISRKAIVYDVEIIGYTKSKRIKIGESKDLFFIIKNNNTGAIDDEDSYTITVTSKNNWLVLHTENVTGLKKGQETDPELIRVTPIVPKNTTLEYDVITFTVTSQNDSSAFASVNVTINVIFPSIFENLIEFFKSSSQTLGFYKVFGGSAPYVLAALIFIVILILIIIMVLLLRKRFVNIFCEEPVKEIDSTGQASYAISIHNPTKATNTYEISAREKPVSPKWSTFLDTKRVTVPPGQIKEIFLTVKATEFVSPHDWTEVKIKAKVEGKKRSQEITTIAMMKDGKPELRINDVFTWPKEFKKGDIVTTYFKLENKGNIPARNVNVVLYVNGKEKNKVEVTVPMGGYADIRMPWIAYKGINRLHIKAIEAAKLYNS